MNFLVTGILVLLPLTALAEIADSLPAGISGQEHAASSTDITAADAADEHEPSITELWLYGHPYSPSSSTNFEPLPTMSLYDRRWLSPRRYEPEWLNQPFGRYGRPYSPYQRANLLEVSNPYLPDSAIDLLTLGWRMETH